MQKHARNALINFPKLRLLLVPKQDTSLMDIVTFDHEERVVKTNEAFLKSKGYNIGCKAPLVPPASATAVSGWIWRCTIGCCILPEK
jgi:hypothetical protein